MSEKYFSLSKPRKNTRNVHGVQEWVHATGKLQWHLRMCHFSQVLGGLSMAIFRRSFFEISQTDTISKKSPVPISCHVRHARRCQKRANYVYSMRTTHGLGEAFQCKTTKKGRPTRNLTDVARRNPVADYTWMVDEEKNQLIEDLRAGRSKKRKRGRPESPLSKVADHYDISIKQAGRIIEQFQTDGKTGGAPTRESYRLCGQVS